MSNVEGTAMPSSEVYRFAKEDGISRRTLERAKLELGICSVQLSDKWVWTMPEKSCENDVLSLNFEPDLQVAYLNPRKQEELVADKICKTDIREEKQ